MKIDDSDEEEDGNVLIIKKIKIEIERFNKVK